MAKKNNPEIELDENGDEIVTTKKAVKPVAEVNTKVKKNDLVTVVGTGSGKYLKADETLKVHRLFAKKLEAKGAAKILSLLLFCFALSLTSFESKAQQAMLSSHNLPSDTVTNTGTAYLQTRIAGKKDIISFHVTVTEISGSTGGTLTLQGSNDGVTFFALTDANLAPAIATKTPADVTTAQGFGWWIFGNPFLYYRVSYTGTGTMSARFSATAIAR